MPVSGSGLGLAISKSIAEIYGGKIEEQSQAGQGATFTVSLPGVGWFTERLVIIRSSQEGITRVGRYAQSR